MRSRSPRILAASMLAFAFAFAVSAFAATGPLKVTYYYLPG